MVATVSGAHGSTAQSLSAIHGQIASLPSGGDNGSGLFGGQTLVPGSAPDVASGGGHVALAGQNSGVDSVVATNTVVSGGGVTLQLADGSSINVLGAGHIDPSLFHK